ncbi:MAG: ectoine/hydroxyectoine ABC transporter permease subunit EhuC [Methylobacteriaceae bacterium]|jgi:polar amino acid transport system permease protein|nr:ectoine/hydroxyectoine ABC transporter permease subunit EhuC [Methylobacteriaceae bacterium]
MSFETAWFIAQTLAKGAVVTLEITVLAALLALPLGFAVALLRVSPWRVTRLLSTVYVEFLRGTSALVQLFYLFFVFPPLFGVVLSPMETGVIGLGVNFSAYASEIIRSALINIDRGQRDAVLALDFPPMEAFRRVLLPQVMPLMLPPLGILLIELLKSTSLVYTITLMDLTFAGHNIITSVGYQTTTWTVVLLCYFMLAWPLSRMVKRYERHLTRHRTARGQA